MTPADDGGSPKITVFGGLWLIDELHPGHPTANTHHVSEINPTHSISINTHSLVCGNTNLCSSHGQYKMVIIHKMHGSHKGIFVLKTARLIPTGRIARIYFIINILHGGSLLNKNL